mgnify:CR=1 FL=1
MNCKKVIKAFRKDALGRPRFLFHALDGSSLVPLNTWIRAENKLVTDGSSTTSFRSGFHSFPNRVPLRIWQKSLKHEKYIALVKVRKVSRKLHSKNDVVLSDYMYLSSRSWEKARRLAPGMAR